MATLTIGISGSAVVNGSKNYTPSDAQVTKLIALARRIVPLVPDTRTDAQVLVALMDSTINSWSQAITKFDVDAAVAQTVASTPPVVIT
jgi:hypothetical protein